MTRISSTIPVFNVADIRSHVQDCANKQWNNLLGSRMVCVGMTPFPSSPEQDIGKRARAIVAWFTDMRGIFELDLPLTLVIAVNENVLVLISGDKVTYADS